MLNYRRFSLGMVFVALFSLGGCGSSETGYPARTIPQLSGGATVTSDDTTLSVASRNYYVSSKIFVSSGEKFRISATGAVSVGLFNFANFAVFPQYADANGKMGGIFNGSAWVVEDMSAWSNQITGFSAGDSVLVRKKDGSLQQVDYATLNLPSSKGPLCSSVDRAQPNVSGQPSFGYLGVDYVPMIVAESYSCDAASLPGALLYKIVPPGVNQKTIPFKLAGTSLEAVADKEGEIIFSVNDNPAFRADNQGEFIVTVTHPVY